jgi:hypothetical protein
MYIKNLLNHLNAISRYATAVGGSVQLNGRTMILEFKAGNRYHLFQPQFSFGNEEGLNYTSEFQDNVSGFIGWLPYFNKRWNLARQKLLFKDYAAANGLHTPQWWTNEAPGISNFIVKKNVSSFGRGIRGPFRSFARDDPAHRLEDGEFYERFIDGAIMKIWYWNAAPAAVMIRAMPCLDGDGVRTPRQMLSEMEKWQAHQFRTEAMQACLDYFGFDFDKPIPAGIQAPLNFKYGSQVVLGLHNENILNQHEDDAIGEQLRHIGSVLWQAIPGEIRENIVYTVDAMLDAEGTVQVLEMNSNPTVHPDVYAKMLPSYFPMPAEEQPTLLQLI